MITVAAVRTLFDYNAWANTRVLQACEALSPEQWDRPMGHSWGSVHALLAHMLAAEVLWLRRWEGESPTTLVQPEEVPTLAELRAAWERNSLRLRSFIAGCDDGRLAADLAYRNTRGQPHSLPLGQLMLHLANHGTHHRGELAAMLTLLDVPHPEDDMLFYFMEKRPGV